MTLALLYRPRTFAEIVGQQHVKPVLLSMVKNDNPPAAFVFSGSRGTGKTSTARIFAAALNCEDRRPNGDACAQCTQCRAVQRGSSLAVIEVDAASSGGVDHVRKLKEIVSYVAEAAYRVVLLDEAHSMTRDAFNALLKVLEEPPPQTVFVLLTTEQHKILETVRSRSMTFEFRRLTSKSIVQRLAEIATTEGIDVAPEVLAEIASRVQGGMRDAVMLLDQISRVGVRDVADFRSLFGIRDVADSLLEAAIAGDHVRGSEVIEEHFHRVGDASSMVNDLTMLVTDLLVVRSGGRSRRPTAEERDAREALSRRVTTEKLVAVIRVLWDLRGRTRMLDWDQRAAMEMAFVMMTDAIREASAVPITQNGAEKRVSLSDMVQLAGSPDG